MNDFITFINGIMAVLFIPMAVLLTLVIVKIYNWGVHSNTVVLDVEKTLVDIVNNNASFFYDFSSVRVQNVKDYMNLYSVYKTAILRDAEFIIEMSELYSTAIEQSIEHLDPALQKEQIQSLKDSVTALRNYNQKYTKLLHPESTINPN